jgi:hypothetical protein
MAIRLKWKNPNTGSTVVRIYRSATPLNTAALPAPIVEITNGATTYLDEFPKYGESFYYIFSVLVNGRELFTPNKYYSCLIDLGPGPKDIILGDFKFGYFGTVLTSDLGFGSTLYGQSVSFTQLYKLVRNGKIIYAPLKTITAYGRDLKDLKVLTSGVTPKNDPYAGAGGMIREFNGRQFALRVAKMWDDANADITFANYTLATGLAWPTRVVTPLGKSELIDILRVARPADPFIQTRFSFGTDTNGGGSTNEYGTCDFTTSTTPTHICAYFATSGDQRSELRTNTRAETLSGAFHPVIEYKGLA